MLRNLDIMLGTDDDLSIVNGDLELTGHGIESIRQAVQIRLRLFRGELFVDQSKGIPYIEEVFTKIQDTGFLRGIFRDTVLRTPGIAEVSSMSIRVDQANRELHVAFRATTEDGDALDIDEVIL